MKHIKKVSALLMCALIALSACLTASADTNPIKDTTKECSITVKVYENYIADGEDWKGTVAGDGATAPTNTEYKGLAGVTYAIYEGDQTGTADLSSLTPVGTITTDSNGTATKSKLDQGVYTLVLTSKPDYVYTQAEERFKVTLPMTNADETGFIYDVKVFPKVQTVYGDVTITKVDDNGNALKGAKFTLYRATTNGGENANAYTNEYAIYDLTSTNSKTVTLPWGWYRLEETTVPTGYTKGDDVYFEIPGDWSKKTSGKVNAGHYEVTLDKIYNYSTTASDSLKVVSDPTVKIGQDITWTIYLTAPAGLKNGKSYVITDNVPDAFEVQNDTVKVYYSSDSDVTTKTEATTGFSKTVTDNKIEISYNESQLAALTDVAKIIVEFHTKVNADPGLLTGVSNTANAVFTNKGGVTVEQESKSEKVKTGKFEFTKVDKTTGYGLSDATFEVYTDINLTEKVTFYTDAGLKKVVTQVTSDSNGKFTIYGLDGGDYTYYLKEVKAPDDYELVGTAIPFNNKNGGIQNESLIYNNNKFTIINEKSVTLPFTGGVGPEVVVASGVVMMVAAGFVLKKRVK